MDHPWVGFCHLQQAPGLWQAHENMSRPIWRCLRQVLLQALQVCMRIKLHTICFHISQCYLIHMQPDGQYQKRLL